MNTLWWRICFEFGIVGLFRWKESIISWVNPEKDRINLWYIIYSDWGFALGTTMKISHETILKQFSYNRPNKKDYNYGGGGNVYVRSFDNYSQYNVNIICVVIKLTNCTKYICIMLSFIKLVNSRFGQSWSGKKKKKKEWPIQRNVSMIIIIIV